LNILA